jgi:tRNA-specific 2-thiouridylase
MSGGVDSAVAAARCVAAGYEVVGLSLRLARDGQGGCCSLDDFQDAREVADRLGFPHYVLDASEAFERHVVAPFVAEYLAGRTPNPCARCNEHVKFDLLWRRARELGAARMATGHYARIAVDETTGRRRLEVARDRAKDQTYFLFMLGQAELARTLFPVGDMTKVDVRRTAAAFGLAVADKPESMEVCFVPRRGTAAFVEARAPRSAVRTGSIVDDAGREIGRHAGIHRFTVGQRRGLGLAGGARRYVRAIDAASATVYTGVAASLQARGLVAGDVTWVDGPLRAGAAVAVRVRHRHALIPARVTPQADATTVVFDAPGPAVSPGQAVVFYRGDAVMGGGWITRGLA